jgi:hypothetical protein
VFRGAAAGERDLDQIIGGRDVELSGRVEADFAREREARPTAPLDVKRRVLGVDPEARQREWDGLVVHGALRQYPRSAVGDKTPTEVPENSEIWQIRRMRSFVVVGLVLVSCTSPPAPFVFDGGHCQQRLEDGGFTPDNPDQLACLVPGDTCVRPTTDDRCVTTCACGDAGWSCGYVCPTPNDPCLLGAFCTTGPTTLTVCETDDAGCSRVCGCNYQTTGPCQQRCP